jgi:hypothetical protein
MSNGHQAWINLLKQTIVKTCTLEQVILVSKEIKVVSRARARRVKGSTKTNIYKF